MDDLAQDQAMIRELVDFTGLTPAAIAKRIGSAVTTIQRHHKGTAPSRLGRQTLEKLRAEFPDFPGWADKLESPRSGFRHQLVEEARSADLVEIDEIDMRYGMGASDVSGHVEPAKRVFSREWLRNFTDARPGQLYWAIGQGDSMEPTISSGDLILIDRSQDTMFDRDLIWACTVGDFGMIKRLRPTRDGVTIMSDNPSVTDDFATDGELTIIGRVIAKVGKL
ncbi:S24 family peptidase [Citromicrobium bathyomarinum]|mgnify:CR=1 FL=1